MTEIARIEAEIMCAFKGLVDACERLDAHSYFEYVDKEKFTGLGADGKVWHAFENLEHIVSTGFQAIEKILSLDFSNVKISVINPTTAVLVNEYTQTILLKNAQTIQQAGGGTQVWSKSGADWKLVSISASDARQRADAVF